MKYSIIDTEKGEAAGFTRLTHRLLDGGSKMIVNGNELLRLGDDMEAQAKALGGEVLSLAEAENTIKREGWL